MGGSISVLTAYVGGTFDLFHPGHVNLLREASRFGQVTVGLNTDEFAARYKRKPIMTLGERMVVVSACRWVSHVIVNEGDEDSKPAILRARARYVVHGSDWQGNSLMDQMGLTKEFLDENNIMLVYVPYTVGVNSSDLIERCRA